MKECKEYCDRCGKETRILAEIDYNGKIKYQMCPSCMVIFWEWLKEETK